MSYEMSKFTVPLCIVVTHLTEIVHSQSITENEQIRFLTMDMERGQVSSFKIAPGVVKTGYGIECAKPYLGEGITHNA